jgi:fluoride exporter
LQQILFIVAGGSLGALTRYGLSKYISQNLNQIFPWGTLVINLTGSFLIGFFFELFDRAIIPVEWRSLITIGFLGAYTTFSTYSLETLNLLREGEIKLGLLNILASNILGIILVFIGMGCSRFLIKLVAR